jgi:hypothetical protein
MIKLKLTIISLFLISGIFKQDILGQVVNIEGKRKEDKNGFIGNISLGFFLIDNGKKITQFKNVIDLQYKHGAHTMILLNDLNLMRVNSDNLVNAGFQHLRYNYTINDSSAFTLETFFQHQYNPIKLLNRRLLGGLGPRFRIINKEKSGLYIGMLGMYEFEQLSDSLKTEKRIGRLSSYLSLNWDILPNLTFTNISYYQPAFQNPQNFRLSIENNLELKITHSLSFKIGFQANYDSKPPEDIQKLFYYWENALSYEF